MNFTNLEKFVSERESGQGKSVRTVAAEQFTYQKDLRGHDGCVNDIAFSNNQDYFLSGGDDRHVFMWNTSDTLLASKPEPVLKMEKKHLSNIFAVEFNSERKVAYSGGNDCMIHCHDCLTGKEITSYSITCSIYDLDSHSNNPNVFASSQANGAVEFFDIREKNSTPILSIRLPLHERVYTGRYNPVITTQFLIATSRDLQVHDLRNLAMKDLYCGALSTVLKNNAMFADWNSKGSALAALEAGGQPLYMDLIDKEVIRLADDRYANEHTVKSGAIIADRFILSGSDTFDVFAWDLNTKVLAENTLINNDSFEEYVVQSAAFLLEGHRSIVNNVCYSELNQMIISSGVEKIIKVWSPYVLPASYDKPRKRQIGSTVSDIREEGSEGEDMETLLYFDSLLMDSNPSLAGLPHPRLWNLDDALFSDDSDSNSSVDLDEYVNSSSDVSSSNSESDVYEERNEEDSNGSYNSQVRNSSEDEEMDDNDIQ